MLGPNGPVDRNTQARAIKARDWVERSIKEITDYTGKRPTVMHLPIAKHLVLTEVGWADRWPGIEMRAAP